MSDLLYSLPSDIVTDSATPTLTSGAANASYPLANLSDRNPSKPFKATGTACTIRFTFGGSTTLRAIGIISHNLVGATVTIQNNGGMGSTAIAIPSNREDGLSVNAFLQFTASAATQWTLTIAGAAANVAIGEVLLIVQLQTLEILLGAQEAESHHAITHATDYGLNVRTWLGVSQWRLHGTVLLDSNVATIQTLIRSAKGATRGFALVPDSSVNDVKFVDLMVDERSIAWVTPNSEIGQIDLDFQEIQRGVAL